jgi:hypothetical protein
MKIYIAKIEIEYEIDENNYFHWEDAEDAEGREPRSKEQLISEIIRELAEIVYNGVRSYNIEEMITVEEKGN